jgi:hypothetical protein
MTNEEEIDRGIAHVQRVLSLLTKDQELSLEFMHVTALMLLKHWARTCMTMGTCSACAHQMAVEMLSRTTGDWLNHNRACLQVASTMEAAEGESDGGTEGNGS